MGVGRHSIIGELSRSQNGAAPSGTREVRFGYLVRFICSPINNQSLYSSCFLWIQMPNPDLWQTCHMPLPHSLCLVPRNQAVVWKLQLFGSQEKPPFLAFLQFRIFSAVLHLSASSPHTSSTAHPPSVRSMNRKLKNSSNFFFLMVEEKAQPELTTQQTPTKLNSPERVAVRCTVCVDAPSHHLVFPGVPRAPHPRVKSEGEVQVSVVDQQPTLVL